MAAVEFAEASPEPALDTLYENLYVLDSDRLVRGRRAQPRAAPRRARGGVDAGGGARARRGGRRLRRPARRRRGRTRPRTATPELGVEPEVAQEVEDQEVGRAPRRRGADGDPAHARGAARRDGRGDAPRRGRLRDRRGRRRLPGGLQGHRGPARGVRRAPGARHADLREHDRRRRGRARRWAGCGRSSS